MDIEHHIISVTGTWHNVPNHLRCFNIFGQQSGKIPQLLARLHSLLKLAASDYQLEKDRANRAHILLWIACCPFRVPYFIFVWFCNCLLGCVECGCHKPDIAKPHHVSCLLFGSHKRWLDIKMDETSTMKVEDRVNQSHDNESCFITSVWNAECWI